MFIGVSTASLYPMETEKTIDKLAQLGVKNIEIFLEANCEAEQDFCKLLKDKLDFYGINVVSVHSFCAAFEPFLFSEYKRRSNDALLQFTKVCKAMGYLGASYYTFHGNRNIQSNNYFSYREYSLVFTSLARIARECGGLLAWENVSWCQSGSVDFLKNCMQYLDYRDFGFTLDLKQALRSNESIEDYISVMKGNLVNVHVSDYNDASTCVLPGDGKRNFEEVLSLLNRFNYDKALILEVYSDCYQNISQIKNSVNFLEGLLTCYE
ncbi:MAG: sugar phosphate isomerase/epimerase [Clostridia bacterium]|nr:sugar phosphate isomerase/epimerase [Clostridia bacterium]